MTVSRGGNFLIQIDRIRRRSIIIENTSSTRTISLDRISANIQINKLN